jgi:fermentation-respiration switch protein FrsA (DUF1100 family)
MTDHRIKAVATVSCFNMGPGYRRGWYGTDPDSAAISSLDEAAKQRTAEAQGAEARKIPYVPWEIDEDTIPDMREAHDYYRTPRAQHPNSTNQHLFAKSISKIFAFDAFHLVDDLLTQPILMVAGSDAGSLWHTTRLHGLVRSPKKVVIVEGGTHMDFYDVPKYVDHAVEEATPFFKENLE